ncbi:MAG: hypothetical protein GXP32_05990 [Kiritimatiellaeota bacterium]|nr:hypothetical protein [Kiritimatiellota bacterium]
MMNNGWIKHIQWDFPGGMLVLLAVVLLIIAAVILSYRFSLRNMTGKQRFILTVVRVSTFTLIFFCLCDPRVVMEKKINLSGKRKIAVIFDNSSSMCRKGFSGKSRMDDALTYWRNNFKKAGSGYDFSFFSFAGGIIKKSHFSE